MENQHRKITGYRELSQAEIDLMNRIKAKGAELMEPHGELLAHLSAQVQDVVMAEDSDAALRIDAAEPRRWAAIGKTDIQTGIMALVRAVAQPSGV